MAIISFVHTDFLRLASPIVGLTDCPAWLQKRTADAVRHAARQVFETAISRNAAFVLIAGEISSSAADHHSVAEWWREQTADLKRRGIRTVARTGTTELTAELAGLCDVALRDDQVLEVSRDARGAVQLRATNIPGSSAALTVSIGHQDISRTRGLCYQAIPGTRRDDAVARLSAPNLCRATAGAVQALGPQEQLEGGCIVAEADLAANVIQTEVVSTDVIRFTQEELRAGQVSSPSELVRRIVGAASARPPKNSRTEVVDWIISADVQLRFEEVGQLTSAALLNSLRSELHGGHQGTWPRTVKFSEDSTIRIVNSSGRLLSEFAAASAADSIALRSQVSPDTNAFVTQPATAPVLTGLELLRRVS